MSNVLPFHSAPLPFDVEVLRTEARRRLSALPLIQRASQGDVDAAQALHFGFWPFVREFEKIIDSQLIPRAPLWERFGRSADIRQCIMAVAGTVRQMKAEEGSHAKHWARDARELGITLDTATQALPTVQALIQAALRREMPDYFAVLAGTEIVAEELAALLVGSPDFTRLFGRGRWVWGEVHLLAHQGASHLDIDLDLARAYCRHDVEAQERLPTQIIQTISLFERAACEIEARLLDPSRSLPRAA
jgi:hypothetical protein